MTMGRRTVRRALETRAYPTGIKAGNTEMAALDGNDDVFHPSRNDTISFRQPLCSGRGGSSPKAAGSGAQS